MADSPFVFVARFATLTAQKAFTDTLARGLEILESIPRLLSRFEQKLDAVAVTVSQTRSDIMANVADLRAQVAANTQVVQSALTLVQGLVAQLEAAKTDPVALDQVIADLKASDTALAAAVAANTPAAPAPEPTPAPAQ
jgi:ATP/maltotriose-dependent transcriptional regulator MalT